MHGLHNLFGDHLFDFDSLLDFLLFLNWQNDRGLYRFDELLHQFRVLLHHHLIVKQLLAKPWLVGELLLYLLDDLNRKQIFLIVLLQVLIDHVQNHLIDLLLNQVGVDDARKETGRHHQLFFRVAVMVCQLRAEEGYVTGQLFLILLLWRILQNYHFLYPFRNCYLLSVDFCDFFDGLFLHLVWNLSLGDFRHVAAALLVHRRKQLAGLRFKWLILNFDHDGRKQSVQQFSWELSYFHYLFSHAEGVFIHFGQELRPHILKDCFDKFLAADFNSISQPRVEIQLLSLGSDECQGNGNIVIMPNREWYQTVFNFLCQIVNSKDVETPFLFCFLLVYFADRTNKQIPIQLPKISQRSSDVGCQLFKIALQWLAKNLL